MNGIINVYKPQGMTSHDVIYKVRRISGIKKVGHTGTLDPDADGVLPVCIGSGTKLSDMLTVSDKRYTAVMRLGIVTNTQDLSGEVIKTENAEVTKEDIISAAEHFVGKTEQIPPMFSAIKIKGKKLYELARKGIEVERQPRPVTIYSIDILKIDGCDVTLDIKCSKGTYIRTLCHDIGALLKTGAAMASLTRTESAGFLLEDSVTLEQLERDGVEKYVIPPDMMFDYEKIAVSGDSLRKVLNGNPVKLRDITEGMRYRVYDENGNFLCISQADGGLLKMVKCFFGGGAL